METIEFFEVLKTDIYTHKTELIGRYLDSIAAHKNWVANKSENSICIITSFMLDVDTERKYNYKVVKFSSANEIY